MAERVLPADHECTVVEYNTTVGIWRCSCGRAYRLTTGAGHIRAPEMDDAEKTDGDPPIIRNPLPMDGTASKDRD